MEVKVFFLTGNVMMEMGIYALPSYTLIMPFMLVLKKASHMMNLEIIPTKSVQRIKCNFYGLWERRRNRTERINIK